MRTTDGGKTWNRAGSTAPWAATAQALPRWHDGALYWLVGRRADRDDRQGRDVEEGRAT